MIPSRFASHALAYATLLIPATAGITFKPLRAQPGESIGLVTHSETTGGTIENTYNTRKENGTIQIIRDRDLVWTFMDPTADGTRKGMVRVKGMATTTATTIGGRDDKDSDVSPLSGKMFAMTKTPTGDWKFTLDGSPPMARMKSEIDSLKVYLKRSWFPPHEVNLGDSWEFNPEWIKMIIHQDLPKSQTVGTMRLRQIRKTKAFEIAVMDVTIRSTGSEFFADGRETSGTVNLTGELTVNLKTMLDESLILKGTVTSSTGSATQSTKLTLPIELKATKSFVRNTTFLP